MKDLIRELMMISPMLPGTLEKRYNVCGKANCCCKDKKNPKKHGPYYKLSYSVKGKNSSIFVKEKDAELVRKMTDAYRKHRNMPMKLGLKFAELCKEKGFEDAHQEFIDTLINVQRKMNGIKQIPVKQEDAWKKKAIERRKEIDTKNLRIDNLEKSRNDWKEKHHKEKRDKEIFLKENKKLHTINAKLDDKVKALEEENAILKKNLIYYQKTSHLKV